MENTSSIFPAMEGQLRFSTIDYSLFVFMLGISTLIGLYFGCCGRKQQTRADYLLGGKTMKVFPIAMSLTASHLSGISLLGLATEIYKFGTQFWSCFISVIIVSVLISYVYLPVFHKLQLTCCYEYLDLRFDYRIRLISSILFTISTLLYLPLVVYIPALAFSQVSGLSIEVVSIAVSIIVIFYTAIGGLKAVVWTDTIQFACTLGSTLVVVCVGTYYAGGFTNVWNKALEGDRIEFFNIDPDITQRCTIWTLIFGLTVSWLSHLGVNQGCVQRFLAVPTLQDAKKSIVIFLIGIFFAKSMCCYTGLLMYSKYFDCDPLLSKQIERSDQIVPFYVMDAVGNITGLPGLFIAGLVSTALSTMSAHLNTLAGTIYEDFLKPLMPKNTTEKRASDIMKLLVIVNGFICVCLVFVVQKLGGIMKISFVLQGITVGPLLGLFTLGMLFPSANAKGAFWGAISGFVLMIFIIVGGQYHAYLGHVKHATKVLSTDGCSFNISSVTSQNLTSSDILENTHKIPLIFRISFMYYGTIGLITVLVMGILVSKWTGGNKGFINIDYFSPVVHHFLPEKYLENARPKSCTENYEKTEMKTN